MKIYIALAALAVFASIQPAHAQNWHVGVGYSHAFATIEDGSPVDMILSSPSADISVVTARGGYDFTPRLGIEADVGLSLGSTRLSLLANGLDLPGGLTAKLKYTGAVYGKVMLPVNDYISLFARAGGHYMSVKTTVFGLLSESNGDTGLAGGGGVELKASESVSFRFDYGALNLSNTVHTLGVSVLTRF